MTETTEPKGKRGSTTGSRFVKGVYVVYDADGEPGTMQALEIDALREAMKIGGGMVFVPFGANIADAIVAAQTRK
jgi:hypothetical protein